MGWTTLPPPAQSQGPSRERRRGMSIETLGIDIAKNVFQLHGVNRAGKPVFRRRVVRDQLMEVVAHVFCNL